MENTSFVGEGRTGATSDSLARNGIRRSATPRRRTAPPLRTTGCLNEPESTLPVLAFRPSSPKSARAQVHITANLVHQIQAGSQAHRPLWFVWKNNFDPWALRIFGRHKRGQASPAFLDHLKGR